MVSVMMQSYHTSAPLRALTLTLTLTPSPSPSPSLQVCNSAYGKWDCEMAEDE